MASPRFLVVTGRKLGNRAIPQWPDRWGLRAGEASADGTWVAWRLAGANNRELGRSALIFPDVTACHGSVAELQAGVDRAEPLVSMDHLVRGWSWRLDLDGPTVAVSGRSYQRERECSYNLGQFLVAVADASTKHDWHTVRVGYRRGRSNG